MLLQIPELLTAEEVRQARQALIDAPGAGAVAAIGPGG
ncbi:MAG: PKHD-type hydroxylase, partial [Zoogloea sp.]